MLVAPKLQNLHAFFVAPSRPQRRIGKLFSGNWNRGAVTDTGQSPEGIANHRGFKPHHQIHILCDPAIAMIDHRQAAHHQNGTCASFKARAIASKDDFFIDGQPTYASEAATRATSGKPSSKSAMASHLPLTRAECAESGKLAA